MDFLQSMMAAFGGGDFTGMDLNALNNQWAAAQTAQMQPMLQNVIQQNMQNPQVQQAWQQHRMQGGMMSLEQFAYGWAATGGYSAQGMASYQANERRNQANEMASWQGLQEAERQRAEAQANWQGHYAANQQVAGQNLMAQATYMTPMGPMQLPYNLTPGYYPSQNGGFLVDEQRNYFFIDVWGNRHPIQQQPAGPYPFH